MAALLALSVLGACSTASSTRRTDAAIRKLQRAGHERALGGREQNVQRPQQRAEGTQQPEPKEQHFVLDLEKTLALAVTGNRDYQTNLERLYLTALSLSGVRHVFSPRLSSTLGYLFTDGKQLPASETASASIGVSQILGWGGTLSLGADAALTDVENTPEFFSSSARVRLIQPLLRGAGHEVSHDSLIQAERDMIYATRDFELFRENFSIDVARRFYGLVQTSQELLNQEENLERAAYDRRKAEALFDVGRASEVVVLRAKRQELNSRNNLLGVEEQFEQDLEEFAIFLGLDRGTSIEITDSPPDYIPVSYSMDSAVEVALANRLDLLNETERLDDARRSVRIAKDGLLPDLQLDLGAGVTSIPAGSFDGQHFNEDISGSVTLSLPLDRLIERNAHRRAEIQLDQSLREYEEFRLNVALGVRSAIRELERRQLSVQITEELIRGEAKNKRIAELQFERGDIDNRELVDAEQSLLEARNALIAEQVSYEIARLGLLRDMGILFIDEQGMWKE